VTHLRRPGCLWTPLILDRSANGGANLGTGGENAPPICVKQLRTEFCTL